MSGLSEAAKDLRMELDLVAVREAFVARGADVWWSGDRWADMAITESPVFMDVHEHGSVTLGRVWIRFIPEAIAMLRALHDEAMRQEGARGAESGANG